MVRYARLGSRHGSGNKMSRKGRGHFPLKFGHLQTNPLNQSTVQIWCIFPVLHASVVLENSENDLWRFGPVDEKSPREEKAVAH
jgi:hypothetical protein